MLIAPDELAAIDEWRFSNRIGTRADAIRRLVQIGLQADEKIVSVVKSSHQFLEVLERARADIDEECRAVGEMPVDVDTALNLIDTILEKSRNVESAASELIYESAVFLKAIQIVKNGNAETSEALQKAERFIAAVAELRSGAAGSSQDGSL